MKKTLTAVLGLLLLASVGLAIQVTPYAVDKFNTYMTNAYSWAGWADYGPCYQSWGTVKGMPTFMIESIRTRNLFTAETVKFARAIALPFICASKDTVTATIALFRDYNNGTPLQYAGGYFSVDSLWFTYPGLVKSVVLTYSDATDTPAFFLIGGFALPVPGY